MVTSSSPMAVTTLMGGSSWGWGRASACVMFLLTFYAPACVFGGAFVWVGIMPAG